MSISHTCAARSTRGTSRSCSIRFGVLASLCERRMPEQWRPASFKLRLVLWYAAITGVVLSVFVIVQYEIVEHRLAAEVDRQLRIDFDLTEAQLQLDSAGKLQWRLYGAHGDEGFARLSAWFEVWSEQGELLLRHWPVPENLVKSTLPAPRGTGLMFHTVE